MSQAVLLWLCEDLNHQRPCTSFNDDPPIEASRDKLLDTPSSGVRHAWGYRLLRVAVQHGLLPIILACARWPSSDPLHVTLHFFLVEILGPATVYCHVLADLNTAHFAAAEGSGPDTFSRPDDFQAWTSFTQTIQIRVEVLRIFDSKDHVSRSACDNVEVGKTVFAASPHILNCSTPSAGSSWKNQLRLP